MVEPDEAQHFLHGGIDFRAGLARNAQAERNVLCNGHIGKERISLKHHADIALVGPQVHHVLAVDFNRAVVRGFKAGNHAQNCGLAAARWAEKGDEFTLFHGEVEIMDDRIGAEALFRF